MKKQFKVISDHTVYIDSFEQGEGKKVNFYILESEVKAETIQQAVEEHFNNTVFLPFKFKEAEQNEEKDAIFWSNLVDVDNEEPSNSEIESWKKGQKELYSNNSYISIAEIVNLKFD